MGKKGTFSHFCKLLQCKNFQEVSEGAIWKLTSWRFRKCGSFLFYNFLNQTYGCSKSTESEILSLSSKLCGVKKKRHGYNFEFWLLIWIGPEKYHVRPMFYSYGGLKLKIVAVSFFLNTAILPKKFLRFDPTWGSYNSGLKNYRITNNHIFGIARTSAFIWHPRIPLKKFCKRTRRVCVCIVLVHFGRFSQEVNRKSVKLAVWAVSLNFFAWFYIVCGR